MPQQESQFCSTLLESSIRPPKLQDPGLHLPSPSVRKTLRIWRM